MLKTPAYEVVLKKTISVNKRLLQLMMSVPARTESTGGPETRLRAQDSHHP